MCGERSSPLPTLAGASHRGEFEERLKSVLKEIESSNGGIILFIDEIHLVLGAGKAEGQCSRDSLPFGIR